MLVQLHAQNPTDPKDTQFLMQGEIYSDDEGAAWFKLCAEKWEELKHLRPKGWIPMVCTEYYESFLWAAEPAFKEADMQRKLDSLFREGEQGE